ncbi:MAG TPA: 50S ribosomal protein L24 [Fimbriimonadaceae bacterium]
MKVKIRKGDKVMIIAGKDKGEIGYVAAVAPKEQKAIILKENDENPDMPIPLNAVIKHRKARMQNEQSARYRLPAPIHLSNLMVIDPETQKPTRVGRRKEDGKIVRFAKKSGKTLVDAVVQEKKQ